MSQCLYGARRVCMLHHGNIHRTELNVIVLEIALTDRSHVLGCLRALVTRKSFHIADKSSGFAAKALRESGRVEEKIDKQDQPLTANDIGKFEVPHRWCDLV